MTIEIPEGYESLGLALGEAVAQAARGKGADRHAGKGEPFSDQLIMSIPRRLGPGGECFCLGQALKKICESRRLPPDRARAELLGAINYVAAAWCLLGGGESVFVSAPEDSGGAPFFYEGEQVEFRLRDGKWKPAGFVCMDGSFAIVVSDEGKRIRIPACDVRPAESMPSAPEDAAMPLFAEGERVKYAVQGKWEDGAYVGVDPEGRHVVSTGSSYVHLDAPLVRKA